MPSAATLAGDYAPRPPRVTLIARSSLVYGADPLLSARRDQGVSLRDRVLGAPLGAARSGCLRPSGHDPFCNRKAAVKPSSFRTTEAYYRLLPTQLADIGI